MSVVVKPKPKNYHSNQSQQEQKYKMNQSEIKVNALISIKHGKLHVNKSQLVSVFCLIGWESGASLFNQSESVEKQNQSKHNITFDAQLRTTLKHYMLVFTASDARPGLKKTWFSEARS